jgi:hypothetical protein
MPDRRCHEAPARPPGPFFYRNCANFRIAVFFHGGKLDLIPH